MQREWRILVVDDDREMAESVADALRSSQRRCQIATGGSAALALCRQFEFDVVVSDIRMGDTDGVELMTRLRALQPGLPVILVTAEGSIAAAVEAVKRGAFQYLTKPFERDALVTLVEQAIASRAAARGAGDVRAMPHGTEELIGRSAAMTQLRAQIELVAQAASPVLVLGETGTGKELVARAIHACSPRRTRPFVTVNASAIPETLLESELFGHARGAFTGATAAHRGLFVEADGGTLLLDEIGDMPIGLQPKLLRVLQTGEVRAVGSTRDHHVDVRVIAATHRSLPELVNQGAFRADLYYRLRVVVLSIAPLRERSDDIELLANHFLGRAKMRAPSSPASALSPELVELLATGAWPGNVRELESAIESMVVLAREPELSPAHLVFAETSKPNEDGAPSRTEDSDPCIDNLIRRHVERTLARTNGNKAQAARLLGVDLSTLYRWQRKWRTSAAD